MLSLQTLIRFLWMESIAGLNDALGVFAQPSDETRIWRREVASAPFISGRKGVTTLKRTRRSRSIYRASRVEVIEPTRKHGVRPRHSPGEVDSQSAAVASPSDRQAVYSYIPALSWTCEYFTRIDVFRQGERPLHLPRSPAITRS